MATTKGGTYVQRAQIIANAQVRLISFVAFVPFTCFFLSFAASSMKGKQAFLVEDGLSWSYFESDMYDYKTSQREINLIFKKDQSNRRLGCKKILLVRVSLK